MKKWITDRPYLVTSAIFFIIMVVGWQLLYWQAEDFTFLLLLYFIVTLGIRLDDIARKIGSGAGKITAGAVDRDSVISQLNDIKASLGKINATLNKLLEENKRPDK
jgi:hypothetical protein